MKYVAMFTESDEKGVLDCGPFSQIWHWKAPRSGRSELKHWLEVTVPAKATFYAEQYKTDIRVDIVKHVSHKVWVQRRPE